MVHDLSGRHCCRLLSARLHLWSLIPGCHSGYRPQHHFSPIWLFSNLVSSDFNEAQSRTIHSSSGLSGVDCGQTVSRKPSKGFNLPAGTWKLLRENDELIIDMFVFIFLFFLFFLLYLFWFFPAQFNFDLRNYSSLHSTDWLLVVLLDNKSKKKQNCLSCEVIQWSSHGSDWWRFDSRPDGFLECGTFVEWANSRWMMRELAVLLQTSSHT